MSTESEELRREVSELRVEIAAMRVMIEQGISQVLNEIKSSSKEVIRSVERGAGSTETFL